MKFKISFRPTPNINLLTTINNFKGFLLSFRNKPIDTISRAHKWTEERSPVWGVEACVYAKGFGLSLDDKDENGE